MHAKPRPVLLAYDGSADAKHAIRIGGELLRGAAVIVHVYPLPMPSAAVVPGPAMTLAVDPAALPLDPSIGAQVEERALERARNIVGEGVALARSAGFDPQPELVPGDGVHAVWNAIVSAAARHDASVIVLGHGHLSWLEEKLLGRVDSGVVKHAGRPVLVVPGQLAEKPEDEVGTSSR